MTEILPNIIPQTGQLTDPVFNSAPLLADDAPMWIASQTDRKHIDAIAALNPEDIRARGMSEIAPITGVPIGELRKTSGHFVALDTIEKAKVRKEAMDAEYARRKELHSIVKEEAVQAEQERLERIAGLTELKFEDIVAMPKGELAGLLHMPAAEVQFSTVLDRVAAARYKLNEISEAQKTPVTAKPAPEPAPIAPIAPKNPVVTPEPTPPQPAEPVDAPTPETTKGSAALADLVNTTDEKDPVTDNGDVAEVDPAAQLQEALQRAEVKELMTTISAAIIEHVRETGSVAGLIDESPTAFVKQFSKDLDEKIKPVFGDNVDLYSRVEKSFISHLNAQITYHKTYPEAAFMYEADGSSPLVENFHGDKGALTAFARARLQIVQDTNKYMGAHKGSKRQDTLRILTAKYKHSLGSNYANSELKQAIMWEMVAAINNAPGTTDANKQKLMEAGIKSLDTQEKAATSRLKRIGWGLINASAASSGHQTKA
jgi:hypothetical protein